MKINQVLYIIISSLLFSCGTNKKLSNGINSCFQQKINENQSNLTSDLFNSIDSFERILLEKKLLQSRSKKGYLNMLKNITSQSKAFEEIYLLTENTEISNQLTTNTLFKYKNCIYVVLETNKKSKFLNNLLNNFEKLEISEFKDTNAIENITKLTNFKNDKSRLILAGLYYNYIWSKFAN